MSDAEVLTFTIVSAMFFGGNHELTRIFLKEYGYIPNILSKSRLNRRTHALDEALWRSLLLSLYQTMSHFEESNEYIVDSFPISVCSTARINRSKIYRGKQYHGYSPTRQHYFYGIKVHVLINKNGCPKEIVFTPGSEHDMKAFKRFSLDLPTGSIIYADRAYNNYDWEDFLKNEVEINMIIERRKCSKRSLTTEREYLLRRIRKKIETSFSLITGLFPRSIKAVTSVGFEIKIFNFILAYTIKLFWKRFALA